jgi:hypothetical protein
MFEDLFNSALGDGSSMAMDSAQAEDLVKTLSIGHANGTVAPGSLTGLPAIQAESVDATLKSVTYSQANLVFWPSVPQDRAYSMVEGYNRTNSFGDGGSPYIPEGGSPAMTDPDMGRHQQKVVTLSTRRGVSLQSTLVRYYGAFDAEATQMQAGTLWLLEKLERELYKGQSDFSNLGELDGSQAAIPMKLQNLNLAGLEQQIRQGDTDETAMSAAFDGHGGNDTVIRHVNDVIDETQIEDMASQLSENFARPVVLDWAPKTMSDFVKQFFPKERVNALGILDGRAGYVVRTMSTTAGDIGLRPNVFLKTKRASKSKADRASVPAAASALTNAATTSVAAGGGGTIDQAASNSNLTNADVYVYQVTSCNEQGESAASITSKSVTLSADGNNVTFNITDPAGGNQPTHYAIYRTNATGTGAMEFIGYQKRTGTITKFYDLGRKLPGSAVAYMQDLRPEVLVWKQLSPMLKIPQGTLGTSREFLLWLAGTLILSSPRFDGVFDNITRAA